MNAKISVLVICAEAIIYLLLHNLHDCTLNTLVYQACINFVGYDLADTTNGC